MLQRTFILNILLYIQLIHSASSVCKNKLVTFGRTRSSTLAGIGEFCDFTSAASVHINGTAMCKLWYNCHAKYMPSMTMNISTNILLRILIWAICNSYIMGARDVWHLLHRSTRARSGPRAECNKCHTFRVHMQYRCG